MSRFFMPFLLLVFLLGCKDNENQGKRVPVARIGDNILYFDQIKEFLPSGISPSDSAAIVKSYIDKWAKREFMLRKAEANLSSELKNEISREAEETRKNMLIYNYQRQMMIEKMDTLVPENELEKYYKANENTFILASNIVKALFIKLPAETPNTDKIRQLARSNNNDDLKELERLCFQFAEKFDDFNEEWITLDRLSLEMNYRFDSQEAFLKGNRFFETSDSVSVFLVSIRDYRLRSSLAPFEYVRDDIKRAILNRRRLEFLQSLENGIYNEALQENSLKIY